MNPIPRDPHEFAHRVFQALIGDIDDPKARGFPRLDALRATKMATDEKPEAGDE